MSDTPARGQRDRPDRSCQRAVAVPVHHGELLLAGWAIREDVVLVQASGLSALAEVEVHGNRHAPQQRREVTTDLGGWDRWTVLLLEPGTLPMDGDAYPPGLCAGGDEPPIEVVPWCQLFPWFPGC